MKVVQINYQIIHNNNYKIQLFNLLKEFNNNKCKIQMLCNKKNKIEIKKCLIDKIDFGVKKEI